jgi:formylglycine-generating enzyme required for sulfatase activity
MRLRRLLPAIALALLAPAARADGACPPGMKTLEGGRFRLADGSAEAAVAPFCLDEIEVTAAGYAACVRAGACHDEALVCGKAATYGARGKATHPVNCVDWEDADAFCRAQGKRLPTEAEWEWAARGQARARRYPWGEAPPAARACWDGEGSALGAGGRIETCPVAMHPAGDSADGVHDLGGNVREWTASEDGRFRVVRGGSWGDSLPDFLAAGFRGMNAPDERFELTGFRCAAARGPGLAPVAMARPPPATPPPAVESPARSTVRMELGPLQVSLPPGGGGDGR